MLTTIEMSEVIACPIRTGEEKLITHGISTCICIVLKGTFDSKPFLLMHHWAGIDAPGSDEENIEELISTYSNIIAMKFDDEDEDDDEDDEDDEAPSISINVIGIIGGERAVIEGGELSLTGTEREITALNRYFREQLTSQGYLAADCEWRFHPFLKKDDEAITVLINASGVITFEQEDEPTHTYRP